MSFSVKFYAYEGPEDAINKLNGLTATTKNVTLYSSFDPLAPVFTLDTLLSVNLAEYTFNSKTYLAKITRTVAADNLYVYSGTVDALGTAYLNGCFTDTAQVFSYTPDGNGYLMADNRAARKTVKTRSYYKLDSGLWDSPHILLSVITPDQSNPYRLNPMLKHYVLSLSYWYDVVYEFCGWSDKDQIKYAQSIISAVVVPYEWVVASDQSNVTAIDANNTITLYRAATSFIEGVSGYYQTKEFAPPGLDASKYGYSLNNLRPGILYTQTLGSGLPIVNIPITPDNVDANMLVYAQNIGAINFTPRDIGFSGTITKIGYKVNVDPSGGTVSATLNINESDYKDIFCRTNLTMNVPFLCDTSITNYYSMASSAIMMIGGMASGSLGGLFGGSLTGQLYESSMGTVGIHGGLGGNADLAESRDSFFLVQEDDYIDLNGYQARFGKPDGRRLTLASLMGSGYTPGFIQTAGAHLPQKNLPYTIIAEAEEQLNTGAWLL